MSPKKTIKKIADLNQRLFVRTQLHQERVLQLAELVQAGIKLDPILIAPDGTVVDGRHRIEAYELNDRTEIECIVEEFENEDNLIVRAYLANCGGSLPPSIADTEHTIMMLLDRGVSKKAVGERLNLPPSVARKYLNTMQQKLTRSKLLRAAQSVTDEGMTVPAAAAQHGVEPERLKEFLGGTKKRRSAIADLVKELTVLFKSHGQKVTAVLRNVQDQLTDGDITLKQAKEVVEKVRGLQQLSARSVAKWEARFEGILQHKATQGKGAGKASS